MDDLHLDVSASPLFEGRRRHRRPPGEELLGHAAPGPEQVRLGRRADSAATRFDVPASMEDTSIELTPSRGRARTSTWSTRRGRSSPWARWGSPSPGTWPPGTVTRPPPCSCRSRRPARHRDRPCARRRGRKGSGYVLPPELRREGQVHRPHPGVRRPAARRSTRSRAPNSFAQAHLRHNVEKRSDEAEKTLRRPRRPDPHLRDNLEAAEKRWSATRWRRAPPAWTSRSPPPPRWRVGRPREAALEMELSARSCSSASPAPIPSCRR